MKESLGDNRREPVQTDFDYRTDVEALAAARTKKLDELTDRERRLLTVANSIENSKDNEDTIYGQKLH